MHQKGIKHPHPRTDWIKDLFPKIFQWKAEGKVLLLVDANSGMGNKDLPLSLQKQGSVVSLVGCTALILPTHRLMDQKP
eukprot:14681843-Ditylum_brightwellii.AAC.2